MSKFCNTSHVEPLTTPSNEATLFFHSDEDSTDAGFQIHYSVVEGMPGCGGTFTAMNGEFGPPIQDGVYLKNQLCHYLIRLPKDNRISITFTKFNLEESNTCIFDYIEVINQIKCCVSIFNRCSFVFVRFMKEPLRMINWLVDGADQKLHQHTNR